MIHMNIWDSCNLVLYETNGLMVIKAFTIEPSQGVIGVWQAGGGGCAERLSWFLFGSPGCLVLSVAKKHLPRQIPALNDFTAQKTQNPKPRPFHLNTQQLDLQQKNTTTKNKTDMSCITTLVCKLTRFHAQERHRHTHSNKQTNAYNI